jgi:hypothetical protein
VSKRKIMKDGLGPRNEAYSEVFGQSFDPFAFPFVLSVETLGIEMITETQGFDFAVQPRQICFCWSREVEPVWSSG